MTLKINLAKNTFIYYCIIGPLISMYSLFNLIYGLVLHKTTTIGIGAFSLFGFILIPVGLFHLYSKNISTISVDGIRIGKVDYAFSRYHFLVREKEMPFKDRPIFSILKKTYYDLVIREISTGQVVFEKDLDVSKKDIEKIKNALPPLSNRTK